ncbi:MAG TPA: hypothetical protein VF100_03020 [Thermoanaerobaculia bacterium]
MTRKTRLHAPALLAVLVAVALAAPPAAAQTGLGDQTVSDFSGGFRLGYRLVDIDGAERKYREDIDLDEGPRLFGLDLHFVPREGPLAGRIDRFDLDVSNFGGDPFETLRLDVGRADAFDFSWTRTTSSYFYEDLLVPPGTGDVRLSSGGDFHHFDFERVRDRAELSVPVTSLATVHLGFNRYTRRGEATTTLDLSRDEFELDRPIDESLNDFSAGVELKWDRFTLTLEEGIRDFENHFEEFLPGASLGENPTNQTRLDFFFLEQPYDLESLEHRVRAVARPTDRWLIRAAATLLDFEAELEADERSQGIDFAGRPFNTDLFGDGEIEGDGALFDVDATFLLTDRVAIVLGANSRQREQQGDFTFGPDRNLGEWDVSTTGLEAGLEWAATNELTVAGGVRWEERDVDHRWGVGSLGDLETESTEHTGFFATAGWRPGGGVRVTAELDTSTYDDPFTLVSPTDRMRYRLRGEVPLAGAWSLSASITGNEAENDDSDWDSSTLRYDARVGYSVPTLKASFGYGHHEIDREIDQLVSFGTLFPIDYSSESDFLDARVEWQPIAGWAFGATALLYENDGSFPVDRDDLRAWAERRFPAGWSVGGTYRNVDYQEGTFRLDDYEADVIELFLGWRW